MSSEVETDPWAKDLLDFKSLGATYANLIKSIDDSKVISIEAGFGRGKTFFRQAWAQQLRNEGEIVVEIDVQKSDHSGDPVLSFLGALTAALPKKEKSKAREAFEKGRKATGAIAKAATYAVLREGTDEIIGALTDKVSDQIGQIEILKDAVEGIGEEMSKLSAKLIAAQMAAERVRVKEMPEQLRALRLALTEDVEHERVVILIDELDRCHPDYAIALVEAMKLVFDQPGFVFCLFVNSDYLERLAAHKFGPTESGERYLEKFVDIRLGLPVRDELLAAAVAEMVYGLKLEVPFGDEDSFGLEPASELLRKVIPGAELSMRQLEKIVRRIDLTVRCYSGRPIDLPLLFLLALKREVLRSSGRLIDGPSILPRSIMTPQKRKEMMRNFELAKRDEFDRERKVFLDAEKFIMSNCKELTTIPDDRFEPPDQRDFRNWYRVILILARDYVPGHERMLDNVESLQVG